jgi:hypothetical protein
MPGPSTREGKPAVGTTSAERARAPATASYELLILPWNIAEEVSEQLSDLTAQGTRFVTAVPELRKRSWGDAACA